MGNAGIRAAQAAWRSRQSSKAPPHGAAETPGGPAELVQLTLPTDVVRGLSKIDDDLPRSVVELFERAPAWALGADAGLRSWCPSRTGNS